jgi:hypothetical protein
MSVAHHVVEGAELDHSSPDADAGDAGVAAVDGGAGPAVVVPHDGPPAGPDMADAGDGDVDADGDADVDGDADPAGPGRALVVVDPHRMPPGTKMMFVQVALIEAPGRILNAEPSRIKVAALLEGSKDWSPHDRLHQILTVQRARFVFIVYCGLP